MSTAFHKINHATFMNETKFLPYSKRTAGLAGLVTAWAVMMGAEAATVKVSVENLGPAGGIFLTPVWVGFHDGSFDTYDLGSPASAGLERIAEDGNPGPLGGEFAASGAGAAGGVVGGAPIAPGEVVSGMFELNAASPKSRYFSFASMVIPSNDAFIANGNPTAWEIFDASGGFLGAEFIVLGSMIRDAGTEVNSELPADTAFFGQSIPDTGTPEGAVVSTHPGFLAVGSGGILDAAMFGNGDFTAAGYQVARIRISAVPDLSSASGLLLLGSAGLLGLRRRIGRNL